VFLPGRCDLPHKELNMNHTLPNTNGSLERKFVVNQIAKLRREVQDDLGKDNPLEDVKVSVYWFLFDICERLDFTPKETSLTLGN
jgi:hypothetical protein